MASSSSCPSYIVNVKLANSKKQYSVRVTKKNTFGELSDRAAAAAKKKLGPKNKLFFINKGKSYSSSQKLEEGSVGSFDVVSVHWSEVKYCQKLLYDGIPETSFV